MSKQIIIDIPQSEIIAALGLHLPKGAKVLSVWAEPQYEDTRHIGTRLCVRVEHESYPNILDGLKIPRRPLAHKHIERKIS
jgi:hypothetical protein